MAGIFLELLCALGIAPLAAFRRRLLWWPLCGSSVHRVQHRLRRRHSGHRPYHCYQSWTRRHGSRPTRCRRTGRFSAGRVVLSGREAHARALFEYHRTLQSVVGCSLREDRCVAIGREDRDPLRRGRRRTKRDGDRLCHRLGYRRSRHVHARVEDGVDGRDADSKEHEWWRWWWSSSSSIEVARRPRRRRPSPRRCRRRRPRARRRVSEMPAPGVARRCDDVHIVVSVARSFRRLFAAVCGGSSSRASRMGTRVFC